MSIDALNGDSPVPVKHAESPRLEGDGASSDLSTLDKDIDKTASGSSRLITPEEAPQPQTTTKAAKKRPHESSGGGSTKNSKKAKAGPTESFQENGDTGSTKHTYCHHCNHMMLSKGSVPRREDAHLKVSFTDYLTCTKAKARSRRGKPNQFCKRPFCVGDLARHYDVSHTKGDPNTALLDEVHDRSGPYVWTCPHCQDQCKRRRCHKAAKADNNPSNPTLTLEPAPSSVAGPAIGPRPHDPTKKQRPSHAFSLDFDSDSSLTPPLEDEQGKPAASASKPKEAKGESKPKTQAGKQSVKAKDGKPAPKGKRTTKVKGGLIVEKKDTPKGKGKKTDTAKPVEKKPRAKPIKKAEKPVEPPIFEKVDTRLGRVEAEQKIMLREYLHRFRPILSIPERSLPPLEDFDRPPTEASIKLFAGAMLDLIKEELEHSNEEDDEDVVEVVTRFREELRYYGDLARFANAYKTLEIPLGLRMPKAVLAESRGSANMKAVRALLDLEEHEEVPIWAAAGPSRRTGASRLPQSSEVVRMLLAFAEKTLSSPAIRTDLVWEAPENEARRVHAREQKKENDQWETKRKKLSTDGVRCKSAAATKAHQEVTATETKEHVMRLALANVNLRAALGTRTLRHGPLGTDLDGRVYYCLAHRPIDDDVRPPHGWASGLLVWGVGLPPKPDTPVDEDELPVMVERWCHFGQSTVVRQLVKWLEYRTRRAVEAAKLAKTTTPIKPKATAPSTPGATINGAITPKTAGPSKQFTLDFKATPNKGTPGKSAGKQRLLEVCIPVNKASRASSDDGRSEASSESDLSELSEGDGVEELLSHLLPEGYQPSADLIREEGAELAKRVAEVAEWLEVLEWKGMGEVVR